MKNVYQEIKWQPSQQSFFNSYHWSANHPAKIAAWPSLKKYKFTCLKKISVFSQNYYKPYLQNTLQPPRWTSYPIWFFPSPLKPLIVFRRECGEPSWEENPSVFKLRPDFNENTLIVLPFFSLPAASSFWPPPLLAPFPALFPAFFGGIVLATSQWEPNGIKWNKWNKLRVCLFIFWRRHQALCRTVAPPAACLADCRCQLWERLSQTVCYCLLADTDSHHMISVFTTNFGTHHHRHFSTSTCLQDSLWRELMCNIPSLFYTLSHLLNDDATLILLMLLRSDYYYSRIPTSAFA